MEAEGCKNDPRQRPSSLHAYKFLLQDKKNFTNLNENPKYLVPKPILKWSFSDKVAI